jgi:hypothetical protein
MKYSIKGLLVRDPWKQHRLRKRKTLRRFEVLTAVVKKSSVFWDITPCSPLKVNRPFEGTCRLHLQGRRISQARNQLGSACHLCYLVYSSTLKMKVTCSSETSVDFQGAAWRYIPENAFQSKNITNNKIKFWCDILKQRLGSFSTMIEIVQYLRFTRWPKSQLTG